MTSRVHSSGPGGEGCPSGPAAFGANGRSGVDRALAAVPLCLIALYQRLLSPFFGGACRFYPSCSVYAREAFERRPFLSALWLTIRRLGRCHPFHPGGYDPLDSQDPEK